MERDESRMVGREGKGMDVGWLERKGEGGW